MKSAYIKCLLVCLIATFSPTMTRAVALDQRPQEMMQTAESFSTIIEKAKPAVVYLQVKKEKKGR